MTSRKSSGSSRDESEVEPTRSQNITVSCRRSASIVGGEIGVGVALTAGWAESRVGSAPQGSDRGQQLAAMADRGNADADQVVGRQLRQHLPSTSLSRNAGAYCSSPNPRSHATTSMR